MLMRVLQSLIETLIRPISGGLGQRIRYQYYRHMFKRCGRNLRIDEGVIFQNADNIEVGDDVWFLPYSMITARPIAEILHNRRVKYRQNPQFTDLGAEIGSIRIGNQVAIGAYNIVQGYGGIVIEDRVTTSARVSLYSFSHHPYDEQDRSIVTYANSMVKTDTISCIQSPIVLQEGVWLGLSVQVLGGTVHKNTFIKSNSVVLQDIAENKIAAGYPAVAIETRFLQKTVEHVS